MKTSDKKLNYPEITLFGEQSAAVKEIEPGNIISVIGTVQTDKIINQANGKPLYHERIMGLEIKTTT